MSKGLSKYEDYSQDDQITVHQEMDSRTNRNETVSRNVLRELGVVQTDNPRGHKSLN